MLDDVKRNRHSYTSFSKAGGNMGFNYLYEYVLGKFDCAIGNEALMGQSQAYYDGYDEQYQNEQNQGVKE